MAASYLSSGTHLIADMYGIESAKLSDPQFIEDLLKRSARAAGARIVCSHFHPFGPGQGITGVVLLAESHISIHTWPETEFAAVDIFMCGNAEPQRALELIRQALAPASVTVQDIARGDAAVRAVD